jgi:hypothetical protein
MRIAPLVKATAIVLACCVAPACSQQTTATPPPPPTTTLPPTPTPSPTPSDVTIDVHLQRQPDPPRKCVVSFDDQEAKSAVAYAGYEVIWRVTKNECGDVKKGSNKAFGLGSLNHAHGGQPAKWHKRCTTLPFVPAVFDTPPQVVCFIPSMNDGEFKKTDVEGQYEYELDGDDVKPVDPGLDVRPGR